MSLTEVAEEEEEVAEVGVPLKLELEASSVTVAADAAVVDVVVVVVVDVAHVLKEVAAGVEEVQLMLELVAAQGPVCAVKPGLCCKKVKYRMLRYNDNLRGDKSYMWHNKHTMIETHQLH